MTVLGTPVAILSVAYLVSMMFALGLDLGGGPKESKEEKWAKRRTLVRGLLLNLIVLPLIAFGITRALHARGEVAVALLLLATVPGGRYAPHLVRMGGGNTALAVELTLLLVKATCFTAVWSAKWMLTLRPVELHELPILLQIVVLQLVPFYFGKWLRRTRAAGTDRLQKPARGVAIAVALVALPAVLMKDRGILHLLDGTSWLAVLAIAVVSPIIGWLFGGRKGAERRTFAIGANCRELALALTIASLAFPDQEVHTALFGIWSILAVASLLIASGMRTYAGWAPPYFPSRRPGSAMRTSSSFRTRDFGA